MDANDRLANQQRISNDQAHENSPPGGSMPSGEYQNPDVLARGNSWDSAEQARARGATALKEQQDADLEQIGKAAGIDGGGTSDFKT